MKKTAPLNHSKNHSLFFSKSQLKVLDEAVLIAEDLVSDYYKMSLAQWRRSRYDIKTLKDLDVDEIVDGPFAQVLGYQVRTAKEVSGSRMTDYYKVCFQDQAILSLPALKLSNGSCDIGKTSEGYVALLPFLIYITVHELVHIVRFATFKQIYSVASEVDCAMEEERKVHTICWEILKKVSIAGMDNVLLFYEKWRVQNGQA